MATSRCSKLGCVESNDSDEAVTEDILAFTMMPRMAARPTADSFAPVIYAGASDMDEPIGEGATAQEVEAPGAPSAPGSSTSSNDPLTAVVDTSIAPRTPEELCADKADEADEQPMSSQDQAATTATADANADDEEARRKRKREYDTQRYARRAASLRAQRSKDKGAELRAWNRRKLNAIHEDVADVKREVQEVKDGMESLTNTVKDLKDRLTPDIESLDKQALLTRRAATKEEQARIAEQLKLIWERERSERQLKKEQAKRKDGAVESVAAAKRAKPASRANAKARATPMHADSAPSADAGR